MNKKRLIVIGGGAAGFFCAVNAARLNNNLEVIIIEKSNKVLSKVRVSGGGRCNVTHNCSGIAEMIKNYPRGGHFLKKAFHHFFTTDTVKWFEERGVKIKSEADGRMFPVTDNSESIIDCLIREANKYAVQIMMNADVKELKKANDIWNIYFANNKILYADIVCIACGGFPKSMQFDWLQKLGHTIEEPVPSLFTFNLPQNNLTQLMGIAVEQVQAKIVGTKFVEQGPVLITHWGLSGPSILKLSAWAARYFHSVNYTFQVQINWVTNYNEQTLKDHFQKLRFKIGPQKIVNRNPFHLPQRLWEYLLQHTEISTSIRWADLSAKDQNKLIKNLCTQVFDVKGKTTFREEFVTAGGIRLSEIDVNTMQSNKVQNIFFVGEVIDVDGITGGFNFQNAWTTAWIAAKAIAAK